MRGQGQEGGEGAPPARASSAAAAPPSTASPVLLPAMAQTTEVALATAQEQVPASAASASETPTPLSERQSVVSPELGGSVSSDIPLATGTGTSIHAREDVITVLDDDATVDEGIVAARGHVPPSTSNATTLSHKGLAGAYRPTQLAQLKCSFQGYFPSIVDASWLQDPKRRGPTCFPGSSKTFS